MPEEKPIINLKKPIFFTAIFLLSWQYIFFFAEAKMGFITELRGVSFEFFNTLVDWDNSIIRGSSMLILWLLVATTVFVIFTLFESVSIFLHNKRIEAGYINRPREDFEHLLRIREKKILRHLPDTLWLTGGIFLALFSLFNFPKFIESGRQFFLDWTSDFLYSTAFFPDKYNILISISFVLCFFLWWGLSVLLFFLFRKSYVSHKKEEIEEDHFGAVIED